jgi:hypothetical protein
MMINHLRHHLFRSPLGAGHPLQSPDKPLFKKTVTLKGRERHNGP